MGFTDEFVDVHTYEQALAYLGVESGTPDDFIGTYYQLKVCARTVSAPQRHYPDWTTSYPLVACLVGFYQD